MNDADLEMLELAEMAGEDANETCWSCGDSYNSITFYVSAHNAPHVESYECGCGHRSVWLNHRRAS